MPENDNLTPESTQLPIVENLTPKSITEEIEAEVQEELKNEEAVKEIKTDENVNIDALKKYVKISPTLHIMPLSGDTEHEIFRIFNPQTGSVEERELNDLEKHEIGVKEFKESKIKFRNVKHDGNITTVKFGSAYRQTRKNKNRMQKKSRKLARKK